MSEYDRVKDSDWRAMLRICGEVANLPQSAAARRKHILSSFCELIGARMASVFNAVENADEINEDGIATSGSLTTVCTTPKQHALLYEFLTSPALGLYDPVGESITRTVLERGTVLREHFADNGSWYRSEYFNNLLRVLKLDDQLSCRVILPNGGWAGMCLMREPGEKPFDERDRQVLALFHQQAGHLYAAPLSPIDQRINQLPPRLRPILQSLLAGDSAKQTALKLNLSTHTVNTYIKQLYRTFDVSSRGELFAMLTG